MLCKAVICVVAAISWSFIIEAHTYHGGRCPTIEPMPDFDMNKFLGTWFAIEKTTTDSSCLTYNITAGDGPGKFIVDQVSHNRLFEFYRYTGKISIPDVNVPGSMRVKFPLNILGSASFIVFSTDYTSYAGIFTCQNIGLFHRLSSTLLSRRPSLEKPKLKRLHEILASYNIDIPDLSTIDHQSCFENRPHTDGDVHHVYAESGENDSSNAEVVEVGVTPNLDHDAEWIRF